MTYNLGKKIMEKLGETLKDKNWKPYDQNNHHYYRGEIYFVLPSDVLGSEQEAGRPAVIVSDDTRNKSSMTAEVVYLTTQKKHNLPTHVSINSATHPSTALCEQVQTVSKNRFGRHCGIVSEEEMKQVNEALLISFGLKEQWKPCGQKDPNYYRGRLYYVLPSDVLGSGQEVGRPAVIVSNDTGNKYSTIAEVVYLAAQKKDNLPTHVPINSATYPSIALCEQVQTVSKDRLCRCIGAVADEEMEQINKALLFSFGLKESPKKGRQAKAQEKPEQIKTKDVLA